MKDHKENFLIHRKCRLINPIKSEVGCICKVKINRINKVVRPKCNGPTHTKSYVGSLVRIKKHAYFNNLM